MFDKFYSVEILKEDNSWYNTFFKCRKKAESLYSLYELYKNEQEFRLIEYNNTSLHKVFIENKQDSVFVKYKLHTLKMYIPKK